MVVRNFYVPADVSDFIDSDLLQKLKEANNRADTQDQKDLNNKLEWSSQVEAADGGKTALATAQKFLQTSVQVGGAIKSIKQRKEKKTAEQKKEDKEAWLKFFPDEEGQKLSDELVHQFKENKDDIDDEGKRWEAILSKAENVENIETYAQDKVRSQETLQFLRESSPSRQLNIQEIAATNRARGAIGVWNSLDNDARNEYGNSYGKFFVKHMELYELSEGASAYLIQPEAKRQLTTVNNITAAVNRAKTESQDGLVFKSTIFKDGITLDNNAFIETYSTNFQKFKVQEISKGFSPEVAGRRAKRKLRGLLTSSIWSNQFGSTELTKLKEGLGPKDVPQGEGVLGYDILSNEDWTFLENQVSQRDKAQVDSAVAEAEGGLITAMAGIENKTINPETGETWTTKDLAKLLQNSLVSKDSKIYKQAENWNPHASDKNAIAADEVRVKPEWDVADQAQRTNLIASVDSNYKQTLIAEDNRIKAFDSSISLKNGNYFPTAMNDVKEKVKGTVTFAGAATSDSQEETAKLLNRQYNRTKNKFLKDPRYKDTSFNELNNLINRDFNDWKDQNGWNLPAGSEQGGILTRTATGEFPGVMMLIDAENEKSKGSTASSTHAHLNRTFEKFEGSRTQVVNSGEAYTNAEVISLMLDGTNSMTGEFQGWTADVLIKSDILGISPKLGIIKALKRITTSGEPKDKALTNQYDLKGFLKTMEGVNDSKQFMGEYLDKYTETLPTGDLRYKVEKINIANWTQNDFNQFLALERKFTSPKQQAKDREEWKKKLLKEQAELEAKLANLNK